MDMLGFRSQCHRRWRSLTFVCAALTACTSQPATLPDGDSSTLGDAETSEDPPPTTSSSGDDATAGSDGSSSSEGSTGEPEPAVTCVEDECTRSCSRVDREEDLYGEVCECADGVVP